MCLQISGDAKAVDTLAFEKAYQDAKREIEEHYHLDLTHVRGPVVHVVAFKSFASAHPVANRLDGDIGGDHGWTDFHTGEITVTGSTVMRHESFHYLLYRTGYSNELNAAHEHAAFDEFRDGNWLPRRQKADAGGKDS